MREKPLKLKNAPKVLPHKLPTDIQKNKWVKVE